jgi:hypothetical protein
VSEVSAFETTNSSSSYPVSVARVTPQPVLPSQTTRSANEKVALSLQILKSCVKSGSFTVTLQHCCKNARQSGSR